MDGLLFITALLLMLVGFTAGIHGSLRTIAASLQELSGEMQRRNGRSEQ